MNNQKYLQNEYQIKASIKSSHYKIVVNDLVKKFIEKIVRNSIEENPKISEGLAYDVGAYVGSSVPRIKAMGFDKIVCFEPDQQSFEDLRKSYINDSQVIAIENLGISDYVGDMILYGCDRGRNFLNTNDPKWIKETRHRNLVTNLVEKKINVVTLDSYVKMNEKIPAYVKIDVEGHEQNVLRGMSFKPSILSFEWISELPKKNKECLYLAHALGFEKFNLSTREEEILGPDDAWMSLEQAVEEFDLIKSKDKNNDVWGNAWCI